MGGVKIPKRIIMTNTGTGEKPANNLTSPSFPMSSAPKKYENNAIMQMSIYDIDAYDNNPRKHRNPQEWGELKDSIRAILVQQPIKITKRPGTDRYIVAAGGNSRLQILKELHEETGDDKYKFIPSIFVEYADESDLLVKHILENEQHYDVPFWDKACGYVDLVKSLSLTGETHRAISDVFITRGLAVSHAKIGEFLFAVNKLSFLEHLCQYLSTYKTIDLRKLFNDLQKSELLEQPTPDEFEVFWSNSLKDFAEEQQDATDLDIKKLIAHIEHGFYKRWPAKPRTSKVPEQAQIHKKGQPTTQLSQHTSNDDDDDSLGQSHGGLNAAKAFTPATQATGFNQQGFVRQGVEGEAASHASPSPAESAAKPTMEQAVVPNSRDEGRFQILQYAALMLDHVNLGACLQVEANMPYMFWLEVPQITLDPMGPAVPFLIDQCHENARNVYWFLLEMTGQHDFQNNYMHLIPDDSEYKNAQLYRTNGEWRHIVEHVIGTGDPNIVQSWLMYSKDDEFIRLLRGFLEAYRTLEGGHEL
ncbi:ParB N-terminal domain-containing protein [Hydromonas duriensis]|uniref:ParB family protein of integrating conjugative element (PFGI_1 class) n=1 Tax=Hydromonas duriensis TaxID=1527608 RepID=A0A4V3DJD2_9BURK|nr:ParB N-terminal domain-containing protein [Hydromonas duriensis]TDR27706.1 ParB family protein of integrating conjugative element (PFGI_1 class) [Hydromonas duriensis]